MHTHPHDGVCANLVLYCVYDIVLVLLHTQEEEVPTGVQGRSEDRLRYQVVVH